MPETSLNASGFVLLSDAVPDALLEMRYYSSYNFIGERIDGYEQPCALLTRKAAEALRRASDAAMARGYQLRIFDAYRPQRAVDHFVRWSMDAADTRMKAMFYPALKKDSLFDLGFIARRSGHSRGSTVDLTLFDRAAGRDADMGGVFDFFGDLSHADYTDGLTAQQITNRALLRGIMTDCGFLPYQGEWWHFRLADEPYPDTYFDFPVNENSVK